MPTREEIREEIDWGLRKLIREWTNEEETKYLYDFSKAIRVYLAERGVVIKVDRGLPPIGTSDNFGKTVSHLTQIDILKAGYVAVEPLIKEI